MQSGLIDFRVASIFSCEFFLVIIIVGVSDQELIEPPARCAPDLTYMYM